MLVQYKVKHMTTLLAELTVLVRTLLKKYLQVFLMQLHQV
jgi:hypothetical protein